MPANQHPEDRSEEQYEDECDRGGVRRDVEELEGGGKQDEGQRPAYQAAWSARGQMSPQPHPRNASHQQ